jgi:hypothetical protein
MMVPETKPVDHAALRVNQGMIILLSLLAFLFNLTWLVLLVAGFMLAGTLVGRPGFLLIYRSVLKPLGLVKPDVIPDNPEPHRFAQGLGGAFLAVGSLLLFFGWSTSGWILTWLVIALAALNLFAGFCVGCAVYYWLNRIGLSWFSKSPPPGTFPGTRPKLGA